MRQILFALVDGGRAEGLACADPGARTPISASGNFPTLSNVSDLAIAVNEACLKCGNDEFIVIVIKLVKAALNAHFVGYIVRY